jgi:hypothetical protein
MATIGRISGPMLVSDLERQGVDLSFDGNLIYLDVVNRRVGINTSNPNVELDVSGSANISSNLYVGQTVTVGNLYQLPTTAPGAGQIISAIGNGSLETIWVPGPSDSSIRRRRFQANIPSLLGYGNVQLTLNLGISSIVYGLTVSRPVKVEVFTTPEKNEPNPYTFIATPDHLTDDGVVVLNDGSSYQSRQYSIFANLEDPPTPNIYATITSISPFEPATPLYLSFYYFPAVTDSRPAVEILNSLPSTGYEGKFVYINTTETFYIWANGAWRVV